MDVVRIFNGLGNQMSQYAFYYAKKKRHPFRTCYITNLYDSENVHNGYELDRLFGIKKNKLKEFFLARFIKSHTSQFFGYKLFWHLSQLIEEPTNYDYMPDYKAPSRKLGFTFYWGGWHSEKYFAEYREDLLRVFHFNEDMLNASSKDWKEKINNDSHSCSLHIRRGDFLKQKKWADAITPEYYTRAIAYMKEKDPEMHFYVFSNDVNYCRKTFGESGFHFIDCNSGLDSWQDMFLMSKCHHHINANSTFSWWGAWLCAYADSITIVPKAFISTMETKDIYPDSWIKL